MAQEKIEPPKEDLEDKNLAHFLDDYGALCNNYGYMIAGEMVYAKNGIYIKPVVVKKPKNDKSGK